MDDIQAKMAEGILSDELLAEMRRRIGLRLRIEDAVFNRLATPEAIARFADGIGDPNPLWRDEEYAKRSPYGSLVAPPSWVVSVFAGQQFGWRGLGGFHAGTTFRFYWPILVGDEVRAESTFTGFDGPSLSNFGEKKVVDHYRNEYFNQRGEKVCEAEWYVVRVERKKAREKGKYMDITLPHPWSEEELRQIEENILAERPRGENPRYWEDVEVGQVLEPVTKGPLGITDIIAFLIGGGAPIPRLKAHAVRLEEYKKHQAWFFRDPQSYSLEPIFAVHYNKSAANAMGLPYPYDIGFQRHCWQIHLLTNWMGDHAWIKESRCEYRRFVYYSDVIRLGGRVVRKFVDDEGEYCVEVETEAVNQRGENVMPGSAVIALPSKTMPESPAARRVKRRLK